MTTTASRLDSKGHLLSLYGLTRASTKMAPDFMKTVAAFSLRYR